MTRTANARLAGVTFIAYIGIGIADMMLFERAATGPDAAARVANLAQHATAVGVSSVLELATFFCAAILGVTLYALTRDEDSDIALLAFGCRLAEGVLGAASAVQTLRLLSAAKAAVSATGPDAATAMAVATSLLQQGGVSGVIGATCFAVGSTLFCWLFLRARSIPVLLAWLGVLASLLLVITLPIQIAGLLPQALAWPIWMPMLLFELTLAFWLVIKGTRVSAARAGRA